MVPLEVGVRAFYHMIRILSSTLLCNNTLDINFIRFYFIYFSRLNSISIILFWENTGNASKNYQLFEISNHSTYMLPYLTLRTLPLTLPYILPYLSLHVTLPYLTNPTAYLTPYLTVPYVLP